MIWADYDGGMRMRESIFRKKSLERISSPEEIDEYMKVTSPGTWLVLMAIILLLGAVIAWGITGEIESNRMVDGKIITETVAPVSFFLN